MATRVFTRDDERWEIELTADGFETRGYLDGHLVDRTQSPRVSPIRAKWDADCLCRERLAAGFLQEDGDEPGLGHRELQEALQANPEDLQTYLVYADWLLEHGDSWGELITVQHALHTAPRRVAHERRVELERIETMLLFQAAARLWGKLGETVIDTETQRYASDLIEPRWRCGFLQRARIRDLREVLRHSDLQQEPPALDWLLRELAQLDIALVLESLTLANQAWPRDSVEELAEQTWPQLHHLDSLSSRPAGDPLNAARLVPFLERPAAPRLRQLSLARIANADALCVALAISPLAPQLESLEILQGRFTAGVDALASKRFAALRTLTLTGTGLSRRAEARLRSVLPDAKLRIENDDDDDNDD